MVSWRSGLRLREPFDFETAVTEKHVYGQHDKGIAWGVPSSGMCFIAFLREVLFAFNFSTCIINMKHHFRIMRRHAGKLID